MSSMWLCTWMIMLSLAARFGAVQGQHQSKSVIPTPDDFLVHGLEKIEPAYGLFEGSMYAGLIPTQLYEDNDQDDGALMFWLFSPDAPVYTDTIVVWLNGGPGCSSLGGNLFENGRVTIPRTPAGKFGIDPLGALAYNPYSWTNATMMLYVEQPHGTGFSTGTFPSNETDVGRDFYHFVQNLFDVFEGSGATDLREKKLYFFGESYAGMYVPSIAYYIHQENEREEQPHIKLEGIGLGNGWIDAQVQGPAVIDYAWWHGMIDSQTARAMKQEWDNCKDGSEQPDPFHAFTVPDECGIMGAVLAASGMGAVDWGGPNAYDVTTWDPYTFLDIPTGAIAQFYNNPAVQDALNVPEHAKWLECMPGAGRRRKLKEADLLPGQILLAHDQPVSVVPYISNLLDDAGIRVLVYAGDRDLTTNAQGSEKVLDGMEWSGAAGWADATNSGFERGLWLPRAKVLGGYIKKFNNLEFLVVANSGHLVPYNDDKSALDLITRFLGNMSYLDVPLPKYNILPSKKYPPAPTVKSLLDADWRRQASASSFGGAMAFAIAGFTLGFVLSRRFPSTRRSEYEMVR